MPRFILHDTEPLPAPGGGEEDPEMNPGQQASSFLQRWGVVLVVFMALGGMLTGLGLYGQKWKKNVWVRQVVISGTDLLEVRELEAYAADLLDMPLERIDTGMIRRRYENHPYIAEASVTKELNGIVRVVISERSPLARLVADGAQAIIDTAGVVIPSRAFPPGTIRLVDASGFSLPREGRKDVSYADHELFGVLRGFLAALDSTEYARLLVRKIVLESENKTYFTVSGTSARFVVGNEGNYKEKLKKFEIFWQKVVSRKGIDSYTSVDLRFRDRVFAREHQ
ncbi:MAG: FtsQ-type POTRA domain-containing protein [Prosthecochloris sp.]|nr:FtsQ-type POTRA domain-containing protein [Prosthecochloris sp.]